ncbi:hypothetical protein OCI51_27755 (plasmid) [Lysinibacillus capsici]|uniref:hypothetical protein n=1 Tax=Lysinibacillus capsici TaxID=2115968 RepID=UPI0021D7D40B|nr:hypothetical protein [Lysinibacillus capsici]UYB50365.1 hypothetical protein OCI51_27755 [Lysinibacillus capsici]
MIFIGGFIAKQPNGLYCRFSSVVDAPTHWNMTREDYLSNITGTVHTETEGINILENYLHPFSEVVDSFKPRNMTRKAFYDLLIEMSIPYPQNNKTGGQIKMDQKMQQDGIYIVQQGKVTYLEPTEHGQDVLIWKNGQVLDVERTDRTRIKTNK